MTTVGKNIRYFRKLKRLSQQELGELAHVTQSTISSIEKGTQNPSMVTVEVIAAALQVQPETLIAKSSYDPQRMNKSGQKNYPDDIPVELHIMLEQMNERELGRVMDFSAGLLAARVPDDPENTPPDRIAGDAP